MHMSLHYSLEFLITTMEKTPAADTVVLKNITFNFQPTVNHSKVEAIPVSALPKDTTSELAGLSPN